jgi:hypothetical protein
VCQEEHRHHRNEQDQDPAVTHGDQSGGSNADLNPVVKTKFDSETIPDEHILILYME